MKIKRITIIKRKGVDVFNLEVQDNHNYIANNFLVGNCHSIKNKKEAQSVISITEKTVNASYRMGCSGTLQDCALHKTQIIAMFGSIFKPTSTKKLQDRGLLSKLKIKSIVINYPKDVSDQISNLEWDSQQEFIESDENPRQVLIGELAKSLKENTLVMFRKISHGQFLYNYLLKWSNRKVEYMDGNTSVDDREAIRHRMEAEDGILLVCSFGVASTGINIKNLHNIIFASSYKSKIKIMQSIGRSLRTHKNKKCAIAYDVIDSIFYMKKHSDIRNTMYKNEQFDVEIKEVDLAAWSKKKNLDFFE